MSEFSVARASYRDLVRQTGPAFFVLAFLARLPAAMIPLGVITLVAALTGSFATAGLAAAAYGIGSAAGAPVVGGFSDRFGQRPVGLVTAVANATALLALVAAVTSGASTAAVSVAAALTGLTTPQIGPLVRVRWSALLSRRDREHQLPTAFSYEGAADELSYMAGPAIVGVIALLGGAWLPLLIASVLTLCAAVPFALHPTAPARAAARDPRAAARLPLAPVALLVLAMVAVGAVFGSAQTGVTAFADELRMSGAAGLIYSVLGVGSAIAGIATAWIPARISSLTRYLAGAFGLILGGVALLLAPSTLPGTMIAMLLVGLVSAPYLISVYALANDLAPGRRAATVMTLLASGVVSGVALGAAVAGRLADSHGASGAFAVPLACGLLAVATATLYRLTTRPTLTPAPVSAPASAQLRAPALR